MVQIRKCGRMSKYTEAISSIYFTMHNRVKPKTLGHCEDENLEVLEELAERATPKKPKEQLIDNYCKGIPGETPNEKELNYFCPNCNELVGDEGFKYKYCPNCGQAIDWSEE